MNRNREGYMVSATHRECTACGKIYEITNRMPLCKVCNSSRVKSMSPEWRMHQRAKQRSKSSGLDFSLEVSDIHIPQRCPVLGVPLVVHAGKSGAFRDSPSLDRLDNSRGYTKDNVWVISQLANAMKCHAHEHELRAFARWVLSREEVAPPREQTD